MKNLDEKKLLVKMARMLGQPVDQELLESIEREEKLNKILFKEEVKEKIVGYEEGTTFLNRKPIFAQEEAPAPILVEEKIPAPQVLIEAPPKTPKPEPVFEPPFPKEQDRVQQVVNVLATVQNPQPKNVYRDKELEAMRKTVADIMQKLTTMSWGGGGTGVVRIGATDDFDKTSYGEGRYLKWSNGMFRLDEINPYEIIHNTTEVTSTTYVVQDSDYYIGVNVTETSTIILPADPSAGRTIVIKDESGNAQLNPIHIDGTIDNDAGGATIKINNGAIQLLYRNGWRII